MNKERYFAIGDTHGHYDELMALLNVLINEAQFDFSKDHLVLLGDLVDTGSQVNKLLDWAIMTKRDFPNTFHPLKGNHEDLLLDALSHNHPKYGDYYIWWNQGGRETLKSYTDPMDATDYEKAIMQPLDYIPREHIEFLASLPLVYETQDYFFCHAGLRPGKTIAEQDFTSQQVQDDLLWIRDEFIDSKFDFGKRVIFGHTSNQGLSGFERIVDPYKIGINTLPRNFGYLTALELPEETFYKQDKL